MRCVGVRRVACNEATRTTKRLWIVLVLAALSVTACGEGSRPASSGVARSAPSASGGLGVAPGDGPLAFDTEMSLDAAIDAVPFAISRPSTAIASDASIAHVWVRDMPPGETEVAIEYQSGIMATLLPTRADTEAGFSDVAKSFGYPGVVVEKVGDRTSLIIPENIDGQNLGSIAFVISGVEVVIYGHYDTETLKTVARSVV